MQYRHLNKILINKKAIEHNFRSIQKLHPEARVCPVLKSNAYGHGLKLVSPVFDSLGAPFLVVDSLYEAYELYKLGIKTPVLLTGYTNPQNFKVKKLPFHYAVYDLSLARALNKHQKGAKIHIFVDSGMNREGVKPGDLRAFIKEIKKMKNLEVEGVCSHFADADNDAELAPTMAQIGIFKDAIRVLADEGINPKWRHISASTGALKIKDPDFNMLRVGIGLYRSALEFQATVVQVKQIKKGERVGYNFTFEARRDMKIAILSAGYYEGVDRRLSNKGTVKLGKVHCPIIGRVSMNMTTIDVSDVKNVKVGQKVEIYDDIKKAAALCGTISYDLLVGLAECVRRELI